MVGGLAPPPEDEEAAKELAAKQGVIFVLENAILEVAKVGKVIREGLLHHLGENRSGPHTPVRSRCILLVSALFDQRAGEHGWPCRGGGLKFFVPRAERPGTSFPLSRAEI